MARVLPWRVEQAPWLAAPETAGDRIQLWPRVRGALCLRTQTPHPGPKQRLEAGAGSHGGHKEVSVEALPCSAQLESQGGLQKGIDSGFGVWGLFWFFFFFWKNQINRGFAIQKEGFRSLRNPPTSLIWTMPLPEAAC